MRISTLALVLAVAAACSSSDPCNAPTTGLRLSAASMADLGSMPTELTCAGASISCSGSADVTTRLCDDGYGVAVEGSDATLLIHFRYDGAWTVGARLEGGADAKGDISVAGMTGEAHPAAGTKQAASFDVIVGSSKVNGTYTTTW